MKCPGCGKDNPDYAVYCGMCAGELPKNLAQQAGPRICPSCRTQNPQGQKFCGSCGANLESGPTEGPAFPDEETPEPGWLEPGSTSYSWMSLDWNLRWGMTAVVGLIMGVVTAGVAIKSDDPQMWGFSIFFLILGAIGAIVTWFNLKK